MIFMKIIRVVGIALAKHRAVNIEANFKYSHYYDEKTQDTPMAMDVYCCFHYTRVCPAG